MLEIHLSPAYPGQYSNPDSRPSPLHLCLILGVCALQCILIFSFVRYVPAKYGEAFYPVWADVVGWFMSLASNVPILVVAIYKYVKAEGGNWREVSVA